VCLLWVWEVHGGTVHLQKYQWSWVLDAVAGHVSDSLPTDSGSDISTNILSIHWTYFLGILNADSRKAKLPEEKLREEGLSETWRTLSVIKLSSVRNKCVHVCVLPSVVYFFIKCSGMWMDRQSWQNRFSWFCAINSHYLTSMNLLLKMNESCFCENKNWIKTKMIEILRTGTE